MLVGQLKHRSIDPASWPGWVSVDKELPEPFQPREAAESALCLSALERRD